MSAAFPNLFSPLKLGGATLKNRIVFGAHTPNLSQEGIPGKRHFGYYRERARGGAAMIVVEPMPAHRTGVLTRGNFLAETDELIPHFRNITDECHSHGTVMCHQIYHVGGHGDQENSWEPYWSPSGVPSMHDPWGSHAMTEAEIDELIAAFIECARRDRDAGFDGVDLFAGYNCAHRPVLVAAHQQARRQVGRQPGEPPALHRADVRGHPHDGGAGLHHRHDGLRRRALSGRAHHRRQAGDHLLARQRGLVDYFSFGTGSYLNQFSKIVPSFHFGMFLGRDDAAALQGGGQARTGDGRSAGQDAGQCRKGAQPRARPTWSPSCAARSPIRISPTRPRRAGPPTSARASPATSCASAGACATTGSPASSIRRPAASTNGAAMPRRRAGSPRASSRRRWRAGRAGGWRGWRPSAATRCVWLKGAASWVASSASRPASPSAARSASSSTGASASSKSCR